MRLVPGMTPERLFNFLDENQIWDYHPYDKHNHQHNPYMWVAVIDSDFHLQFARKYENPPELRINPEAKRTNQEIKLTLSESWRQKTSDISR